MIGGKYLCGTVFALLNLVRLLGDSSSVKNLRDKPAIDKRCGLSTPDSCAEMNRD
jgi:hypothetical protein